MLQRRGVGLPGIERNRDRRHPIVPSHLADPAGLMTVASKDYQRSKSTTPRPY